MYYLWKFENIGLPIFLDDFFKYISFTYKFN